MHMDRMDRSLTSVFSAVDRHTCQGLAVDQHSTLWHRIVEDGFEAHKMKFGVYGGALSAMCAQCNYFGV